MESVANLTPMTTSVNLSRGAIMKICTDNSSFKTFKPVVLQVIDIKRARWSLTDDTPDGTVVNGDRCLRLTFSDGSHSIDGVIAKNLEELVQSGGLQKSSVVALTQFFFTPILSRNRKVLIITGLHVAIRKCLLIGNPVLLHKSNSADHPNTFDNEDIPQAKEKRKTEEPIPACHSKQLVFYYSNKGEEDLKLSANLKEFDDFCDNLITSKEIEFDKMWSDFMLELECMKLGWERDEYQNTDLSAMNMFKRVSNGEIVSDDEEEEEREPSHVDA